MIDFFFVLFRSVARSLRSHFGAIVIYVVYGRDSSVHVIHFIFGRPINVSLPPNNV